VYQLLAASERGALGMGMSQCICESGARFLQCSDSGPTSKSFGEKSWIRRICTSLFRGGGVGVTDL
jgi:hypothetical protein